MAGYYKRSAYNPGQKDPYKISRSKIELFMQCKRCFWLDARLSITRPNSPPFTLNKAIDELLKKEFDVYRKKGDPHPLMTKHNVTAVPMQHEKLEQWRHNFTGVATLHQPTNLWVYGAIDDLWIDTSGRAIVVDYKATAKDGEVGIDSDWQISYKRQLEVYQWLLRENGLSVADEGYFVYTSGRVNADGFFDKLEFQTKLILYKGNDSWVEPTLGEIKMVLEDEVMPPVGTAAMGGQCEFCSYARKRTELTLSAVRAKQRTTLSKVAKLSSKEK